MNRIPPNKFLIFLCSALLCIVSGSAFSGGKTSKVATTTNTGTGTAPFSFKIPSLTKATTPIKTLGAVQAPDQILVRFKNTVSNSRATGILTANQAKSIKGFKSVSGLQLVQLPDQKTYYDTLAKLKNDPNVLYAEPDYFITPDYLPNDNSFPQLWGMDNNGTSIYGGTADSDINAAEAWDVTQGSSDVVVAVVDTGVDYTHEDLSGNIWINPNEIANNGIDDDGNGYVDDIHGIDAADNDSNPMDDDRHGTHVAGTIAANGDNGIGVAGVSWNTKVIACKIFSNTTSTSLDGNVSDAIACLDYLYDLKINHGINIIATNNSWGWTGPASKALEEAIARQADAGIIFVTSAGNATDNNDLTNSYPTNYYLPNVISVAATTSSDERATFSNYGKRSVHVAAPGEDILSTVPGYNGNNAFTSVYFNDVEGDQSQWQADSPWAITNLLGFSGYLSWADSPGDYTNNANTALVSPAIDLSALGGQALTLGFLAQYQIEEDFDYLYIEASGNNGTTWETLGSITGANKDWELIHFPIPAGLLSNQFRFRFRLETDNTIVQAGVLIDDIGIGVTPPGLELPSNLYSTLSGTSMASPHVTGLLSLIKAQDPTRDWKQLKNLVLAGGTPTTAIQDDTISGRRIRAFDTNGTGSLSCNNQHITRRLMPLIDNVSVGASNSIELAVLNINCDAPAGNVTVTVMESGAQITLLDNGLGFDQTAGDGIYSTRISLSDYGTGSITLQFPDNSQSIYNEVTEYTATNTSYQWRNINATGTALDILPGFLHRIDLSGLASPFNIPFADKLTGFNAVGVSRDGYLILLDSTDTFLDVPSTGNLSLPFNGYYNYFGFGTIIAPFWDDLTITGNNGVFWAVSGQAPNRELVIEWRNISHIEFNGNITFQAVFFENSSDILFNYQDVVFGNSSANNGASATIGIQTTATSAVTYSDSTASINNASSLLWSTNGATNTDPGTGGTEPASPNSSGSGSGSLGLFSLGLLLLIFITIASYRHSSTSTSVSRIWLRLR